MLTSKPKSLRNAVDLNDSTQVRALTKRLGISELELRRISETSGNSIAAIAKEVELDRASGNDNPTRS